MDNIVVQSAVEGGYAGFQSSSSQLHSNQRFKNGASANQSALNLLGSQSKRSLFNFAAHKTTTGDEHHQSSVIIPSPNLLEGTNSMLSLTENKSPRKASQPNSSVFSLNKLVNEQLMTSSRGQKRDASVTHEQLIAAKKRQNLLHGYQSIKPGYKVDGFLSKKISRNSSLKGSRSPP